MGKGTPKAKPTREEQAGRLRQHALALQTKGMTEDLQAIGKARPDLVPLLLQHAYSLGAPRSGVSRSAEDEGAKGSGPEPKTLVLETRTRARARMASTTAESATHDSQIWERITNLGSDTPIQSFARAVSTLKATVIRFNQDRGRPLTETSMPPQWSTGAEGIFELLMTAKPIALKKRDSGTILLLPPSFVQQLVDPNALYVYRNFSERDAAVVDPNGFGKMPCITLFPHLQAMQATDTEDAGKDLEEPATPQSKRPEAEPPTPSPAAAATPRGGEAADDAFVPSPPKQQKVE